MNYYFLLALSILFFGAMHSFTASNFFKSRIKWFKRKHYNFLSLLLILPIIYAWTKGYESSPFLYIARFPLSLAFYFLMLTGTAIFILGAREMDLFDFFGIKEAKEKKMVATGMHSVVRHPLYLGLIILIWSFPKLKFIDIIGNAGITLYLIAGAFIEERKLLEEFGEEYEKYKKEVPMFLPECIICKRRRKE